MSVLKIQIKYTLFFVDVAILKLITITMELQTVLMSALKIQIKQSLFIVAVAILKLILTMMEPQTVSMSVQKIQIKLNHWSVVVEFLKEKLPEPIAGQLDAVLEGDLGGLGDLAGGFGKLFG